MLPAWVTPLSGSQIVPCMHVACLRCQAAALCNPGNDDLAPSLGAGKYLHVAENSKLLASLTKAFQIWLEEQRQHHSKFAQSLSVVTEMADADAMPEGRQVTTESDAKHSDTHVRQISEQPDLLQR